MSETSKLDDIKKALTCNICQDISTIPVHPLCCETAKSMNPGCLSCVKKYYQLNKQANKRDFYVKSWSGCGCNIYLSNSKSHELYIHTPQLDTIRNLLGPSKCNNCDASFDTTAELKRHIAGEARDSDKHKNCLESIIKCKICNFYGKRIWIEGEHFIKEHTIIKCDVCEKNIKSENLVEHYDTHCKNMVKFQEKIKDLENKMELALKINS